MDIQIFHGKITRRSRQAFLYAIRILIGCLVAWWTLGYFHDVHRVWALVSVIVVSDPDFGNVRSSMISRIINTVTGCALGLLFIYFGWNNLFFLMTAIVLAIFISAFTREAPSTWKLAPVTVIIIMTPSMAENMTWHDALLLAISRTIDVLYGSMIAFVMGWLFTIPWKKLFHHEAAGEKHAEKT